MNLEQHPTSPELSADTIPTVSDEAAKTPNPCVEDAQNAAQRRSTPRLAEVPAEVVVANHVMGLYELAAIHLGAAPPDLGQAALAIDAVACLVEGLGDRLGPDAADPARRAWPTSAWRSCRSRPPSPTAEPDHEPWSLGVPRWA